MLEGGIYTWIPAVLRLPQARPNAEIEYLFFSLPAQKIVSKPRTCVTQRALWQSFNMANLLSAATWC